RRSRHARRAGCRSVLPVARKAAVHGGDPGGAEAARSVKKAVRFLCWLAVAAAAIFLSIQLSFLVRVWWWKDHNPQSAAFMEARIGEMRRKDPQAKLAHSWQPYDRISGSLKRAIVVAEDSRFIEHEGFDWEAIDKAREKNKKRGKVVAGGSTISQQLAK